MNGEPCSIGLVTYTAKGFYETSYLSTGIHEQHREIMTCQKVSFRKNERRRKGYQFTGSVVMIAERGAKRIKKKGL